MYFHVYNLLLVQYSGLLNRNNQHIQSLVPLNPSLFNHVVMFANIIQYIQSPYTYTQILTKLFCQFIVRLGVHQIVQSQL